MTSPSTSPTSTTPDTWRSRLRLRLEHLLAGRRARQRVVVAWVLLLLVTATTSLAGRLQDPSSALLVLRWSDWSVKTEPLYWFLLAAVVGVLLRVGIGHVADLPDTAMDERQIAVRDRSYLLAYQIISAVVGLLVVTGYIILDAVRTERFADAAAAWAAGDAIWTLMPLLAFLPSAVLAWTAPDEVEREHDLD